MLSYSKVLKLLQIMNKAIHINSKNLEKQKKIIQLHASRSTVTALKNSNEMSEPKLNCTNEAFKLQLGIVGIARWPRKLLILEWV